MTLAALCVLIVFGRIFEYFGSVVADTEPGGDRFS